MVVATVHGPYRTFISLGLFYSARISTTLPLITTIGSHLLVACRTRHVVLQHTLPLVRRDAVRRVLWVHWAPLPQFRLPPGFLRRALNGFVLAVENHRC